MIGHQAAETRRGYQRDGVDRNAPFLNDGGCGVSKGVQVAKLEEIGEGKGQEDRAMYRGHGQALKPCTDTGCSACHGISSFLFLLPKTRIILKGRRSRRATTSSV